MSHTDGKRTFLKWAEDYIVLPTVRLTDHWDQRLRPGQASLGSGAVITTGGLDSAIRGVLVGTKRPDLVIIDAPETRDSARSGVQTDLRARTIEADLAGRFEQETTEGTEKPLLRYLCYLLFIQSAWEKIVLDGLQTW